MPQQTINIGATANDGTGDTIRVGGAKINDNFSELYLGKADLASPALTGNPTAPTQAQVDDSTKLATTGYVRAAISALLNGVSAGFDTLVEIAAALNLKLVKSADLSDVASAPTAFTNIKQAATDAATGVVELATTGEAQAGTDPARVVTPAGLRAAISSNIVVTGDTTLTDAHFNKLIHANSESDIFITLPNNLTVGFSCSVVQEGVGQIFFIPAAGANLEALDDGNATLGRYAVGSLEVYANSGGSSADWRLYGGITPVADVTRPTLSNPLGTTIDATSADLSVDTNEGNGTIYWVVTQSGTAPTKKQVRDGLNHLGAAAVADDTITVSSTGTKTDSALGLVEQTNYFVHFMQEDAVGHQSSVVSSAQFTTDEAEPALVWDDPWTPAAITISGASLVATKNGATSAVWTRSNVSKASGKWYIKLKITHKNGSYPAFGITNSTTAATGAFLDDAGFNFVMHDLSAGGVTWKNGANLGAWYNSGLFPISDNMEIELAFDLDNSKIYARVDPATDWNATGGADPATNTGGRSLASMTGPFFIAAMLFEATSAITIVAGGTPPSGFTNLHP